MVNLLAKKHTTPRPGRSCIKDGPCSTLFTAPPIIHSSLLFGPCLEKLPFQPHASLGGEIERTSGHSDGWTRMRPMGVCVRSDKNDKTYSSRLVGLPLADAKGIIAKTQSAIKPEEGP